MVRLDLQLETFAIAKARCCLLMSGALRCFRTDWYRGDGILYPFCGVRRLSFAAGCNTKGYCDVPSHFLQ